MKYTFLNRPKSSIDMTALMDIIFLVLIFFMVGTTFEMNRSLKMNLPETLTAEGNLSESKILIEADVEGNIAVNGQRVDLTSLSEAVLNLSPNENTEIYIMGDENLPYKTIVQIMDIIKILGLEQISLVTDIKKEL
ncbi:MAG: biopolymer transporter ExbD [Spirochaetales bacterium]|nr:biopolymer transporter ExbD [Spirochaetales bacterium]